MKVWSFFQHNNFDTKRIILRQHWQSCLVVVRINIFTKYAYIHRCQFWIQLYNKYCTKWTQTMFVCTIILHPIAINHIIITYCTDIVLNDTMNRFSSNSCSLVIFSDIIIIFQCYYSVKMLASDDGGSNIANHDDWILVQAIKWQTTKTDVDVWQW